MKQLFTMLLLALLISCEKESADVMPPFFTIQFVNTENGSDYYLSHPEKYQGLKIFVTAEIGGKYEYNNNNADNQVRTKLDTATYIHLGYNTSDSSTYLFDHGDGDMDTIIMIANYGSYYEPGVSNMEVYNQIILKLEHLGSVSYTIDDIGENFSKYSNNSNLLHLSNNEVAIFKFEK